MTFSLAKAAGRFSKKAKRSSWVRLRRHIGYFAPLHCPILTSTYPLAYLSLATCHPLSSPSLLLTRRLDDPVCVDYCYNEN